MTLSTAMVIAIVMCVCIVSLSMADTNNEPVDHTRINTEMYKVYRIIPTDEAQLTFLTNIYEEQAYLDLDFWKAPSRVGAKCDVMIQNMEINHWLEDKLNSRNMAYSVIVDDVEGLIKLRKDESEFRKLRKLRRLKRANADGEYDFESYGTYAEMIAYMRRMVATYPNLAQLVTIGDKTYDGNVIYMMKIGNPVTSATKRAVWLDAGIHSREWASQHVAMYFIHKLLTEYDKDATVKSYVDNLNFYIVPVVNPDGYIYTQSSTNPRVRLWRKNRNMAGGRKAGDCFGIDLNRNFDFHWGEAGSSTNPCSEVYQGASAFSEVESRAIRDTLNSTELRGRVDMFITLHTYSQLWIHPYGHKEHTYPPDRAQLVSVGNMATAALKQRFKTSYKVASGADALC